MFISSLLNTINPIVSYRHVETKLQSCTRKTTFQYWRIQLTSLSPCIISYVQCESKNPPWDLTFFIFLHKRLRICNRFFTHLLNVPIFARLQIFIQVSSILTKLCHIKRYYPVHIICAKCPKRAKTRAFRRLRKSLIALLIVACGKSL